MLSEDSEQIIAKFKRHGHPITRKSLERTQEWLKEAPNHSLDRLIKQLDHLALESSDHERNLHHALHILSLKQKNLNSYEDLLDKTCKRSIFSISPYEYGEDTCKHGQTQGLRRGQTKTFSSSEHRTRSAMTSLSSNDSLKAKVGRKGLLACSTRTTPPSTSDRDPS